MAVKEGDFNLYFPLDEIGPDVLSQVLDGWDIQEHLFATSYQPGQPGVESTGWIIQDPANLITIEIDKGVRSAYIYDKTNSILIRDLRSIGADPELSLVGFNGFYDRAQLVKISQHQFQLNYFLKGVGISPSFTWKIGQSMDYAKWESLDPLTFADYLAKQLQED